MLRDLLFTKFSPAEPQAKLAHPPLYKLSIIKELARLSSNQIRWLVFTTSIVIDYSNRPLPTSFGFSRFYLPGTCLLTRSLISRDKMSLSVLSVIGRATTYLFQFYQLRRLCHYHLHQQQNMPCLQLSEEKENQLLS